MSVGSAIDAPSNDTTSHINRQPSTAGMDTLADLASMQHHQQTARANAGGLKSVEIYESPANSASAIPALIAMSRPQTLTQPRENGQLRAGSLDFAMTDGPSDSRSPREYSTAGLSCEEAETITLLVNQLGTNPFAYKHHVELIKALHHALVSRIHWGSIYPSTLLQDLQHARETMNDRFALGEDLWKAWIEDQILLARSLEDHISVVELCERAVREEPNSREIWDSYSHFVLSLYNSSHPEDERFIKAGSRQTAHEWSADDKLVAKEAFGWEQVMGENGVFTRSYRETMWRFNDSHIRWDAYTEILIQQLHSAPPQDAFAQLRPHFLNRLQIPHARWEKTLEMYSGLVSRYNNARYEDAMIEATQLGAEAKTKSQAREFMETNLLQSSESQDEDLEVRLYREYLEWELSQSRKKNIFDSDLICALFQRATLRFPARTEFWEGYAMFLIEAMAHGRQDVSAFPVLERATRHCPWSGALWSQYLLAAENKGFSFTEVEGIKHRATRSGLLDAGGMEEILKIHTAWCGFLRRRAIHSEATDEDFDVAEVGIRSAIENMETLGREKYGDEYQGDPEYRLEKIYIKCLSQGRYWENAREELKKLIPRKGDSYDFWLRYYLWEMGTWGKLAFSEKGYNAKQYSKPTEATKVLARAMSRPNLDWPEKIIETYQYHCEDNEDAEELQASTAKIWKAKKAVQKRREREAYAAYEAAQVQASEQQQSAQQKVNPNPVNGDKVSKRKREDDVDAGGSKKIRPEVTESIEPTSEEQQPSAPSVPSVQKRDRENATVVVKNLSPEVTDTRLRQYFRDVSTMTFNAKLTS